MYCWADVTDAIETTPVCMIGTVRMYYNDV